MMMKKQLFERNFNRITTLGKKTESFDSISLTKKASHKLQNKHGRLGDGQLRIIPRRPTYEHWAENVYQTVAYGINMQRRMI